MVVMPTYECDFKCTYCFEDFNSLEGAREGLVTPQLLLNWVEKLWHVYEFKALRIVFYGGEPLLRKELLKNYVKVMREWGTQKGVKFSFSIITNGALCSEEFIQDILEYGLEEMQVTIDGVKEVHDQRRPFRNGKGSFEVVYSNILRVANLAINKLVIRTNIDEHNRSRFRELVQLLKRDGLFLKKNVVFMPALVDPSPSKPVWCNQFISKLFDK
ncbi:MAG: radical SAM protein [Thermoanaerobacter sp.]|nr:radical SAM protein [Thermoanaerobacter sp.]